MNSERLHHPERPFPHNRPILLPYSNGGMQFHTVALSCFDLQRCLHNIDVVNRVAESKYDYAILKRLYQLQQVSEKLELQYLHNWNDVRTSLVRSLDATPAGLETPLQPDDLYLQTQEQFMQSARDITTISWEHGQHYIDCFVAHELNPDAKIGLLVYDNHHDLYQFDDEPTLEQKNAFTAANVQRKLLEHGVIDAVAVVGVSDSAHDTITSRYRPETEEWIKRTKGFYQRSQSKIKFLPQRSFLNKKGFNEKRYVESMDKIASFFQQRGVTHLITAVDMDVFTETEQLTAVPYGVLSQLLHFGIQHLSLSHMNSEQIYAALDTAKLVPESFIEMLNIAHQTQDFSYNPNRVRQRYRSMMSQPRTEQTISLGSGLPYLARQGRGLTVDQVITGHEVLSQRVVDKGIELGIPINGDVRYMGTVTEVYGRDYQDRTAQAALKLTQMMKRS
ncbi:MAG: hypothetical protein ACEQSA_00400 [Weeksellaceae bacterium]